MACRGCRARRVRGVQPGDVDADALPLPAHVGMAWRPRRIDWPAGAAAMVLFHTLLIAIAGAIVAATLAYNFVPWGDLVQWNCESAKQAAWDWLRGL